VQQDVDLTASNAPQKVRVSIGDRARAAVRPKNIGLLIILLAAAAICGRLGVWQLDRAYERANLAREHALAESEAAAPVMLGTVLAPQARFGGSLVGQRVQVTGEFEPENTVLVPGRVVDGEQGYLVVSSLVVTEDGTDGQSWAELSGNPRLPVVRGWVSADQVASTGGLQPALTAQLAAQAAAGPATLVGWLQASESTVPDTLPAGQMSSISSAALANLWGGPIYGGYLVTSTVTPAQPSQLIALPRPTIEGGTNVNLQNFFYALQWWVFGLFALALWLRLITDDARKDRSDVPANPFDLVDERASR